MPGSKSFSFLLTIKLRYANLGEIYVAAQRNSTRHGGSFAEINSMKWVRDQSP
jgi:hypothetical protein